MSGSGKSNRASLLARLALGAAFLAALAGTSFWVITSFISEPKKAIFLTPDEAATAGVNKPGGTAARAAKEARNPGRNNGNITFTGEVVDATTHQPVPKFNVRMGYNYTYIGNSQPTNFMAQAPKAFTGGKFKIASPFNGGTSMDWCVRIEADGYLPVATTPTNKSGAIRITLTPGTDLQGTVLSPAGTPVVGANVALAIVGIQANVDLNTASQMNQNVPHALTNAEGKFRFSPQVGRVTVVAMSDEGFARLEQDGAAKDWQLHESPWGKIDGHLTIAAKPGANEMMRMSQFVAYDPASPQVFESAESNTDGAGHFVFNRVPPGRVTLGRAIQQKNAQFTNTYLTQTQEITLAAGQTVTVQIGGAGRPVIGRLMLPPGAGKLTNYFFNQNINGITPPPPPPQMPEKVRNASATARQMWMELFGMTPVGQQYLKDHPESTPLAHNYAMEIAPDGKFRIDDVVPGDYQVWINVNPVNGGRSMSPGQAAFTMPPVPQGYSDEPLDIGEIKFTMN